MSKYADWRERLSQANSPEFWPITAIDEMVTTGRAQFWCDGKSALVTRGVLYPGGAVVLEALAAAGEMESLRDTIAVKVEEWAQEQGYTHLMIAGRPGWARVHKSWKLHQNILIKGLRNGQQENKADQ